MQPGIQIDGKLRAKLPIADNCKIIAVYKHHWFAYVSILLVALFAIVGILGVAIFIVAPGSSSTINAGTHKSVILAGAALLSVLVAAGSLVPIWLKLQERVVLTEEAILQVLQPTVFASKVSQLNLEQVSDVSVRQQFLGTILGYGKISIETPGEQDDYEFTVLPNPHHISKDIILAHENYIAALQAGRLSTTLGGPATAPGATGSQVDPEEYQKFLAFEQMVKQQEAQSSAAPVQQAVAPVTQPQPEQPYVESVPASSSEPEQQAEVPTDQQS